MVEPCGFYHLICSVESCSCAFELYRPTPEDFDEPLCSKHKKLRLLDETGCAGVGVGEELEAS